MSDWKLTNGELFIILLIITLISYIVAFAFQSIIIRLIALVVGISISIYETIMFFKRGKF